MSLPSNRVIATLISRAPLTTSTWSTLNFELTFEIQTHFRTALNATTRHLDAPSTSSDNDTTHRISELTIPIPRDRTPPTLSECTEATHILRQTVKIPPHVSLTIQPLALYSTHSSPGLIVFDMDSTLIQQEVIDELARSIGLYDSVAAITEAAMRGEAPYTDFSASLRARVALLKGVEDSIWKKLREEVITFTPGAKELVRVLNRKGWRTAVLSGGFTPLAEWVKSELGLDYAEANFLEDEGGVLTGELVVGKRIVDAERKRELLLELARTEGVDVQSTVAVGDGSNDLKMMHAAGLGIAFNAKPKVQAQAPAVLNGESLLDVLYILGYTQEDIESELR